MPPSSSTINRIRKENQARACEALQNARRRRRHGGGSGGAHDLARAAGGRFHAGAASEAHRPPARQGSAAQGAGGGHRPSLQARDIDVAIADGRVDIAVLFQGKLVVGPPFSVAASLHGTPRYDDGAFYFEPEEVRL